MMEGTEGSSATEMTLSVSEFTQQEIHTDLPIAILAFFYTQFLKLVKETRKYIAELNIH
jgi:hypothetical protein